jgi:large repetitive protein
VVTVAPPVPLGPISTKSSQMVVDGTNRRVWTVNPDSDTVTSIDADTLTKDKEFSVAKDPRSIAQDANGDLWITCLDADRLEVRSRTTGSLIKSLDFRSGARPHDIVFNSAKTFAFVTLSGSGRIARINTSVTPMVVDAELAAGSTPMAIALHATTDKLLVNRFISPDAQGEVRVFNNAGGSISLANTIPLDVDTNVVEAGQSARGLPNYLSDVAIDPFNQFAYVTAKKDNILRGTSSARDGLPLTFETSVRAMVSKIDLSTFAEDRSFRLDIDNSSQPTAMVFSPLGDFLFIALQGNNHVRVMDTFTGQLSATLPTGFAPQGLSFDSATNRLFINNLTDRKVTVYDLANALRLGNFPVAPSATIATVANEIFPAQVLRGKQVFYNSDDRRMGMDGYMSCALCHQDGGHDGRTWDFTNRGEGLRNTTNLRGRSGMAHGNVHWSGNFDEIQDFDIDMKNHFGGTGFISGGPNPSMGAPNANRDADLDALAAYISSLGKESIEKSPNRQSNGRLTNEGRSGKRLFAGTRSPGGAGITLKCLTCHGPNERLTDSAIGTALPPTAPPNLMHNIATILPTSGQRLGGLLAGIDTPTLLGLHASAPYLHDGRAADLASVFSYFSAAATLTEDGSAHDLSSTGYNLNTADKNSLFAYLNQIDGRGDDDFVAPPAPTGLTTIMGNGSITVDWNNSPAADILEFIVSRRVLNTTAITTVATGVPTSFYVDNTVVSGTTYQYRLTAVDVNDNESSLTGWVTSAPVSSISSPLLTIESWRQTHFGSTANSGDGLDTFDFDNDGLVNLLEYAFGLNPTSGSSVQIPMAQIVGDNCNISFLEPNGVSGITYGAEWNETLAPEGWAPIPDTGTGGQHTFSMSMGSKPKVFMRLKVISE